MSVHAVISDHGLHDEVLEAIQKKVTSEFKIAHATVQVECHGSAAKETHL